MHDRAMVESLGTVAVTGAAGRIGALLRDGLAGAARRLVLLDHAPVRAGEDETAHQTDLRDPDAVVTALAGVDAVVHLGGVPDEAPFPEVLDGNVLGTHHVLEAVRRRGIGRVVLASSNRLTGCYPASTTVTPEMPPRPDGFYGVSKAALEALGRLYADKFGLSVVALRIGSFEEQPTEPRHLATWLSPRDCLGFVRAALTAPDIDFLATYAVSNNSRRFWGGDGWKELDYWPADDAEAYAAGMQAAPGPPVELQGGEFAGVEHTLRHV